MDSKEVTSDLAMTAAVDFSREASTVSNTPSFDRIFEDEAPYVGRTLRYLGVRDPHVEDVCQEVFVVVHKHLGQFRGSSVRAWVRQICVHVARNHRRSLRRRREEVVDHLPE